MIVRCELLNYSKAYGTNEDSIVRNLIVEDAGLDSKLVQLKFGNETAKVDGKELMSAVQRCLDADMMALNYW